jgi:hypothetical protein
MRLEGANGAPRVEGAGELPGRTNYLRGPDAASWRAGVASYAAVRYTGVYEGVDLVYYGGAGGVEYDFVVAPGTDPSVVRMRFSGASGLEVDDSGALVLRTSCGDVRHEAPRVYQRGPEGARPVGGRYVVRGAGEVGFDVGAYDPSLPLVVDPVLGFAAYVGGSSDDLCEHVVVSGSSVYVAGYTASADFPTVDSIGPYAAGFDAFVMKMSAASPVPEYSTYLGGSLTDVALGVAVAGDGGVVVAGYTNSPDFPLERPLAAESRGFDAFVARLDASGSRLVYSTYLGGSGDDFGYGVALDAADAAYVAGGTASADFPAANAFQSAMSGALDGFAAKLSADGASLVYSTYLGGSGADQCVGGVAVDAGGAAYVTGTTRSADFPVARPVQAYSGSGEDAFVTKLSASGSSLAYSTYLGGEDDDAGLAIAVGADGAAYVAGSSKEPDAKAAGARHGGESDAFVHKLAPDGSAVVYTFAIDTAEGEVAQGIAVDGAGAAYVVGYSDSGEFPTKDPVQLPTPGGQDAFLMKLDAAGASAVFSTKLGGTRADVATGVAVDEEGGVYVVGTTISVDFPAKADFPTSSRGFGDGFVVRVDPGAGPVPPSVSKVKAAKSGRAFKVTIRGRGFAAGAAVYIGDDAAPWQLATVKGTKIKLSGGEALEAKFPPGAPVRIRVVNPDGGAAFTSLAR